ncbi:MAG: hypothetical protein JRI85_17530 [Deltaproteobacteria bacterium]|nr:hypothetical protein [Deltaproteobacteria bacterium]
MRPETLRKILTLWPNMTIQEFKELVSSLPRKLIEEYIQRLESRALH